MYKISGFSLAKGKELKGDDSYDVRIFEDIVIGVVCDGVGSAKKGQEASKRVVNFLINSFKNRPSSWSIEKSIKHFIKSINSILYKESITEYEHPEYLTTLALVIIEGNRLYGANVGDSRIYLLRDNNLSQLSIDHSMNEKGYEHVLTQAIGMSEDVKPYYFENFVKKDDKILLCSDGLYNILNEEELKENIPYGANLIVKKASKLVNDNLPDDTTAVVIEVDEISEIEKLKHINLKIPEKLHKNMDIDGYKLIKPLIQNERTWLAENKGKKYVLKFPLIDAKEDNFILDLFIKEAWNAKRLKAGFFPKAVIPIKRSYRYYVMEYLDGINLKEYIKKNKLHIDDAVELAKTLLRMSQYLLKFDLVHGDIKPENIIVLKRKNKLIFKIIDFGSITEIYSINSRAGTASYLAPERFKNEPISESSEIFAIGITIYESLTKKLPYGEIEPFQTPEFKAPLPPKKLNKIIPEWLNTIILKAIEIDKEKRYEHYSEMLFELQHPEKVKPYIQNISMLDKNPLKSCKIAFGISFLINFILLFYLLR